MVWCIQPNKQDSKDYSGQSEVKRKRERSDLYDDYNDYCIEALGASIIYNMVCTTIVV
jgi:hypothetical protein